MGTLLTNINKLGTSYRRLPTFNHFSRMENFKIILLLAIVAVLLSLRAETKPWDAVGMKPWEKMKPWDAVPAKSLAEEADGTKKATKLSNNNNHNKLRNLAKKFSLDKKAARDLTNKVANKN